MYGKLYNLHVRSYIVIGAVTDFPLGPRTIHFEVTLSPSPIIIYCKIKTIYLEICLEKHKMHGVLFIAFQFVAKESSSLYKLH